jgi:glutathione S-transferase
MMLAVGRETRMTLKLIIGNKNYSSWSFRPWIAMKVAGIPFEEWVVSLNDPHFKRIVMEISPAGKVPALADGEVQVWESLAILEYLAAKFPDTKLWPEDPKARAHARAIAAEMHAGFVPLRRECPMNFWRPVKRRALSPEAVANVKRIDAMWADCRARFGAGGEFLFGGFGAADAMYAPVVSRFATYAVEVGSAARAYMAAIMELDAWREWKAAAVQEPWVLPEDEPDWPVVLKA